ncbi:MAG: hypothetical protein NTZ49_00400 [Candidatus Parcubacteria bacterium]|nr:hypothetical protein [Candidatus Parcubacteria bacterium]
MADAAKTFAGKKINAKTAKINNFVAQPFAKGWATFVLQMAVFALDLSRFFCYCFIYSEIRGGVMPRYTVVMPDRQFSVLQRIATEAGDSKKTILNRAVRLYCQIKEAQGDNNLSITVKGKVIKQVVMP